MGGDMAAIGSIMGSIIGSIMGSPIIGGIGGPPTGMPIGGDPSSGAAMPSSSGRNGGIIESKWCSPASSAFVAPDDGPYAASV